MKLKKKFLINLNLRYAYRTQSCYECSSVDGSNPMCEYMDDKYAFSDLDGLVFLA